MIEISSHNDVVIIEFANGKVNAIDIEFCNELTTKLDEANDSACKSVVIGSSGKVFSAGIDLKRWLAEDPQYVRPFMQTLESLFERVFCFPKPIVADIGGAAIAGGCMLAAACDYRVIRSDAKMGILESRLGVPLPTMAIEILRHIAQPQAFRQIISTGATYTGQQAVDVGLADSFCSDDTRSAAIAMAQQLGALASPAFQLTKRQRTDPVMRIVRQNQADLFDDYMRIWESPATRNTIRTYVENRLR